MIFDSAKEIIGARYGEKCRQYVLGGVSSLTRQGEELERDMREMPKVCSLEGSFFTNSARGRIGARYEGNAESMPLGESYRETLFF